jgi:(2Fe-2S) ferredoxin
VAPIPRVPTANANVRPPAIMIARAACAAGATHETRAGKRQAPGARRSRAAGRAALLAAVVLAACESAQTMPEPALRFEPDPRPLVAVAARDPSLHVLPSRTIVALVAVAAPQGGYDVAVATSHDGGDTFTPPRTLNDVAGEVMAHGESAPVLLVGPREEWYALWAAASPAGRGLRLARSDDWGRSFDAPRAIDTGGEGAMFFHAAITADGTLIVVWLAHAGAHDGPRGSGALAIALSRDRGETFTPPRPVATSVCACCRPAVHAGPDGTWYLAWRDVTPELVRDVVVARSTDGGATWSEPAAVSADGWRLDGCPHSGPALAATADGLFVAWYSEAEGRAAAYWSHAADGAAFAPRRALGGDLLDANHPRLAVAGGRVLAAFQARPPDERAGWGVTGVYVRALVPGDGDGAAAPVARGDGSAGYPAIASLGAGRTLVAWTDTAEGGTRALLARGRTEGVR